MTVESIGKQDESTRIEDLVSEGPRLEPIERPRGITLRLIYWMTRRRFGKVPTSLKVVVARSPKMMGLAGAMAKYEAKGVHLDKELDYMINILVAGTNGCGACLDIGRMMAVKENMDMEKISTIPAYRTSSLFSDKERAALAYAEEATLHKRVSDATFHELQKHFGDRDIVEITILTAIQNFANLTNIPLGIGSDGLCAITQSRRK